MALNPQPFAPVPSSGDPWNALQLGTIQGDEDAAHLRITEELLRTHLAIFGGTRYGKSKLFELICRELIALGRGFAFIDPHSDTADDLLAFLAAHFDHLGFLQKNIHYLNPSERLFSFDPFAYHPDPDDPQDNSEFRYRSWLHTKIKDTVNIIVRQQGETEDEKQKMVRLRRWLYDVLYAVGVRQDEAGTHLPLKAALVLLNPAHPDHEALFERIEPFLSDEVRADFVKLRSTHDPRKQEDWVESTFNRLRDILSPIVERIFSCDVPSIDFRDIIRRNGVILAALGKTPTFHEDEALAIAGLLIREISEAARTVARNRRKQYFVFIDEAQAFLGEDLLRILKESAKYKLALALAVQGLDNLQKGQIDLVPAVLGQCGIRITFRQQYHEHAEILAKSLCYPMLDFTPLILEAERDDGYDWILAPSVTAGEGTSASVQVGRSHSRSRGVATQVGVAHAEQQSQSNAVNSSIGFTRSRDERFGQSVSQTRGTQEGESLQRTESASLHRSESHGTNVGYSESAHRSETLGERGTASSHGQSRSQTSGVGASRSLSQSHHSGVSESQGASDSFGRTKSRSHSSSEGMQWGTGHGESGSRTVGVTATQGISRGTTHSASVTDSTTESEGDSTSAGVSRSANQSITLQLTPLHRTRLEQQKTGRLEQAVADQFATFAAGISSLSKQHCLVAVAAFNRAFLLRVDDVRDPFEERFVSPGWRKRAIDRLKEQVFATHAYYFTLDDSRPPLSAVPHNGIPNGRPHVALEYPSPFPG